MKLKKAMIVIWSLLMAFADGIFMKSLCESVFALLGDAMQWGTCGVWTLLLNILPIPISIYIQKAVYRMDRHAKFLAAGLTVVWVLMFAAVTGLRLVNTDLNRQESFTFSETMNEMGTEESVSEIVTVETDDEEDLKALAATIFLCVEPLATSVTTFGLQWMFGTVIAEAILETEKKLKEKKARRDEVEGELLTLSADPEVNAEACRAVNEAMYRNAAEHNDLEAAALRNQARQVLAESVKDPDATSWLLRGES